MAGGLIYFGALGIFMLSVGCIGVILAVLAIDAIDAKLADNAAGQLPDPDSAADPGDRPSRAVNASLHNRGHNP